MDRFLFLTIDGLATGAVYAVFALSLVLVWRAARIVNFAQGAIGVAAAYLGWSVGNHVGGPWLGLVIAPVAGALIGVAVERTALRRMGPEHHFDAMIVALGVAMVIQGVLGMAYGGQYRGLATPLPDRVLIVGGVPTTSPYRLFVLGVVALLVAGLAYFFARTRLGLRLRAAAFAPEVAGLFGVSVARMTTVAWGLSAGLGAFAAMLVVPTGLGLHPTAMDGVFLTAFTAAVLGGLDSAVGAVVGGIAVGLVLNYATGYAHEANLAPVAVLGLLLVVLVVRPDGLFTATARRV